MASDLSDFHSVVVDGWLALHSIGRTLAPPPPSLIGGPFYTFSAVDRHDSV